MKYYGLFFFIFFLIFPSIVSGQETDGYPEIRSLSNDDALYRQISYDIESYYQYEKQQKGFLPPLALYTYSLNDGDTLFGISSRMNLPYETLALLNGFEHPEDISSRDKLIIPNLPGIFIPTIPENELERIMAGWRDISGAPVITIYSESGAKNYYFLPGSRMHAVERAYFLGILFRLPISAGIITSRFGSRISPISGNLHHHNGIDIAAPAGAEVYAARDGTVTDIGYDDVYGNFILISHTQNYQTLYGHLESLLVELNQTVYSGMMIGTVGSTGLSTGPHLHFEIRRKGEARDPYPLMPLF